MSSDQTLDSNPSPIGCLPLLDGFHPPTVFAHSRFPTDEQSNSILRLADWIVANGIDSPGNYRAARDLLLRKPPRLTAGHSLTIGRDEAVVQASCRVVSVPEISANVS